MNFWIALVALWILCAVLLLNAWGEKSVARWAGQIAFRPTEPVSPDQLFGYLLSANFAVLEGDDFNQLGSSLAKEQVEAILMQHWRVQRGCECVWLVERWLRSPGTGFPAERAAYAARRSGHVVDSDAYAALEEICRFLVQDARLVEARQIRNVHLNPAAWEIQQAAYLVRLGFSAGYLSRAGAQAALKRLQEAARAHYASWEDFSLSGLIALGVRSPIDSFDLGNWRKIARSHEVLLGAQRTTLAHAARWKVFAAIPAPSIRRLEPGPQLAEA
ncbi:DUF1266 domain-containing protein [Variovorax sp. MHTC-1]|uniref:DUF1266 domain-containing protein n=1 Tax=Variovorax sp. MHTC-1 TaxID=2495593 RepID=UPI00163D21C2|nr:DUF1266 domain-containing protein [Variovorax sp. MHTC-1]